MKNLPRPLFRPRSAYVVRLFEICLVTQSLFKRLLLMTGTNVVQVLTAYCNMLNILRPAKAPGFAYAWLEIVSHRVFIGRILSLTPQQKGTVQQQLPTSAVLWDGEPDPELSALADPDPNFNGMKKTETLRNCRCDFVHLNIF